MLVTTYLSHGPWNLGHTVVKAQYRKEACGMSMVTSTRCVTEQLNTLQWARTSKCCAVRHDTRCSEDLHALGVSAGCHTGWEDNFGHLGLIVILYTVGIFLFACFDWLDCFVLFAFPLGLCSVSHSCALAGCRELGSCKARAPPSLPEKV